MQLFEFVQQNCPVGAFPHFYAPARGDHKSLIQKVERVPGACIIHPAQEGDQPVVIPTNFQGYREDSLKIGWEAVDDARKNAPVVENKHDHQWNAVCEQRWKDTGRAF